MTEPVAPRTQSTHDLGLQVRVVRARLEQVQPLAAEYQRERGGLTGEPALPTGALFWLATADDGRPLGYAAGAPRPEGIVCGPVYVRPAHRRVGVGLALLREIERWAASARVPLVEVAVATDNEAGVRFLEAAGYRSRRVLMAREPVAADAGSPR